MRILLLPVLFLLLTQISVYAEEESDMSGLNAVSYSAGFRLGDMFIKQKVPIVSEMVMKGLEDARTTTLPLIPKGEMRMILNDPRKYLIEDMNKRDDLAKKTEQSFFAANRNESGVTQLESGLQYRVIKQGQGEKPELTDYVRLDYQAATLNGQVFDSTDKTGDSAKLLVQGLIPGLAEGLQLMSEGAEWELYIPAALAYSNNGPLANQAIVYSVKLLEVLSDQ